MACPRMPRLGFGQIYPFTNCTKMPKTDKGVLSPSFTDQTPETGIRCSSLCNAALPSPRGRQDLLLLSPPPNLFCKLMFTYKTHSGETCN